MTPEGVEHPLIDVFICSIAAVKIPMTPEGVEHAELAKQYVAMRDGENSYDAGRR